MKQILPELDPASSLAQAIARASELLLKHDYALHDGAALLKSRMILDSMRRNRGNACRAARELHLHRNTLSRNVEEFRIGRQVQEIRRGDTRLARKPAVRDHVHAAAVPGQGAVA